jgi:hypothetical protein
MTKTQDIRIIDYEATPTDVTFSKVDNPIVLDNSFVSDLTIGSFSFILYTPPVIPLGAVYPVPGHVRAPDQYGPSGNDYTGNEIEPSEADVKKNIKYGANGTEFTGTLEGGSGTTKHRIRNI